MKICQWPYTYNESRHNFLLRIRLIDHLLVAPCCFTRFVISTSLLHFFLRLQMVVSIVVLCLNQNTPSRFKAFSRALILIAFFDLVLHVSLNCRNKNCKIVSGTNSAGCLTPILCELNCCGLRRYYNCLSMYAFIIAPSGQFLF